MTTPSVHRNGFPVARPGTRRPGAGTSRTSPGTAVGHAELVAALADAGLDTSVAREVPPRHALARAGTEPAKDRITRPVAEDDASVAVPFTPESRAGDKYEYIPGTVPALEKATGKVGCERPGPAAPARELVDAAGARTGADIARCVKRVLDRRAGPFPVREKGRVPRAAGPRGVRGVGPGVPRTGERAARSVPGARGDAATGGTAAAAADHRAAAGGSARTPAGTRSSAPPTGSSRSAASCRATPSTWPTSGTTSREWAAAAAEPRAQVERLAAAEPTPAAG